MRSLAIRDSCAVLASGLMLGGCSTKPGMYGPSDGTLQEHSVSLPVESHAVESADLGPNQFHVRCREFERTFQSQKFNDWCWAACVSMVLEFHGRPMTQEDLVRKFKASAGSQAASASDVVQALAPELERRPSRPQQGQFSLDFSKLIDTSIEPQLTMMSSDRLIADLAAGYPVVIGLNDGGDESTAHLCVIYGATYARFALSGTQQTLNANSLEWTVKEFALYEVEAFDPMPDRGAMKLTVDDLKSLATFMVSRREAIEIIQAERQAGR